MEVRTRRIGAEDVPPRSSSAGRSARPICASVLTLLTCWAWASQVRAYEEHTHYEIVDTAYQTMRLVTYESNAANPSVFSDLSAAPPSIRTLPGGVNSTDWNELINAIPTAYNKLNKMRPTLHGGCAIDAAALGDLKDGLTDTFEYDWRQGKPCSFDRAYKPGGQSRTSLFNVLDTRMGPYGRYSGTVLGMYAADPDYWIDDWRSGWKLTNMEIGPAWLKDARQLGKEAVRTGAAILLFPFVCAARLLGGDSCGDIDDSRAVLEQVDPITAIEGMIPVVPIGNDKLAEMTTGFGHFIMVAPTNHEHLYDDRRGFWLLDAGGSTLGRGVADVAVLGLFDLAGLTVDYENAEGPRRYQFTGRSRDGHPQKGNGLERDQAHWEQYPIGQTVFTPLDNLAFAGWRDFIDAHERKETLDLSHLSGALHALGDAAAPHHLVGSFGMGHRPYEVRAAMAWDTMVRRDGTRAQQYELVRTVLVEAVKWRKFIRDWRTASNRPKDIPVRDMITAFANENYAWVTSRASFPYDDLASTEYHTYGSDENLVFSDPSPGREYGTENFKGDYADMRALLIRAMGIELAFLVSVTDLSSDSAPPAITGVTAKLDGLALTKNGMGVFGGATPNERPVLALTVSVVGGTNGRTIKWYSIDPRTGAQTLIGSTATVSFVAGLETKLLYRVDVSNTSTSQATSGSTEVYLDYTPII